MPSLVKTHPYSVKELLERVNGRRQGRALNTHDYQVICWKENLKDDEKYAWKHSNAATHVWSGDAVSYLSSLDDDHYDKSRAEYRTRIKTKKSPAK